MILTRYQSREAAMQMLFQMDQRGISADESIVTFWESLAESPWNLFADELVLGVSDNLVAIDQAIQEVSETWRLDRMAAVDRAILRLGTYEIVFLKMARPIVINEYVDLTKKYGGEQSPAFVNGLLDRIGVTEGHGSNSPSNPTSSTP